LFFNFTSPVTFHSSIAAFEAAGVAFICLHDMIVVIAKNGIFFYAVVLNVDKGKKEEI
jgi:hypothetical protein